MCDNFQFIFVPLYLQSHCLKSLVVAVTVLFRSLQEHTVAHPAYPKEKDEVKNPEAEGPTGPQNQYPAEGLQVYLIAHGSHKKAEEDIWYCQQCGYNLADYLKNDLKIGSRM